MNILKNSDNGFDGRFYIYKYDENTVYKKIKNEIPNQKLLAKKIKKNFLKYKNIIKNIHKVNFLPSIKGYDVESDGSYKCKFINGYRLDRIGNLNLKFNEIVKIKCAILKLKGILNKNAYRLSGDWALHNLIYSINDDKIYNIDLEGFFSYPSVPKWGNINFINKWLDDCDNKLNEIISRTQYFTIILWNPTLFQSKEILQDIPNIIEKKEISISNDYLHKYIFDIYKFDTRCSHNIVLPPKIKKLKEYNNKHLIVKFIIDNPTYKNNICIEAVNLKEIIRKKYKSNIKNYTRGMMIHIADDLKQSKYIWEKNTENLNIIKLLIQEASSPLRYKLSKKEKNGKDRWHTIDTMNVYESYIEGTGHFFVYRAANPRRYCLSKEKINDNNWEYYYDFYCKESEIDKRMTIFQSSVNTTCEENNGDNHEWYYKIFEKHKYKPFYGGYHKKLTNKEKNHIKYHENQFIQLNNIKKNEIRLENLNILNQILIKNHIDTMTLIWGTLLGYHRGSPIPHDNDDDVAVYGDNCQNIFKENFYNDLIKNNFIVKRVYFNKGAIQLWRKGRNVDLEIWRYDSKSHNYLYGYFELTGNNPLYPCTLSDLIFKYKREVSYYNFKFNIPVLYKEFLTTVYKTLDKPLTSNYYNSYNVINPIKTHLECYNFIMNLLNTNNIKFVIIRGFKYLPLKPDTDLDIVIHPDSYNKFIEIYSKLKNDNLIRIQHPTKYTENGKDFYYTPLFTAKHLKEGEHLPGNYYRFDTYSDLFFYKDGEGKSKNAIICNPLFKKYLFDNLIKVDNYYIPNPISEIILLIYRNLYDKRGKWCRKHMMRINELLLSINKDEFNKISIYCFTSKQNIYEHLITKNFDKISKPNQKLNLFIIRKKGMKREIIENILNQIQNEYQILDKILTNINNKKKFYSNFYGNYDKNKDDIEKNNDNQCLAIITNNPNNKEPNELKQKIRKQYIKFYPPLGNIIHSSDSSHDCENELNLLFNENIDNFNNIGTYYSQVDM